MHKPPLKCEYGTHHSKAFILVYETGIRIIVHTANLIFSDCNDKTQGLFFQDFPRKSDPSASSAPGIGADFEETLLNYVNALRLPDGAGSELAAAIREHDFSSARAALVPSIPGRHQGPQKEMYGHMRLREVLSKERFPVRFAGAPVCAQASSVGALSAAWLHQELGKSMCTGLRDDNGEPLLLPLRGLGASSRFATAGNGARCCMQGSPSVPLTCLQQTKPKACTLCGQQKRKYASLCWAGPQAAAYLGTRKRWARSACSLSSAAFMQSTASTPASCHTSRRTAGVIRFLLCFPPCAPCR